MAACTDRAYMSIWNVIALSTVVGNPIRSVYPHVNGPNDKTPSILNKVFSTDENKHRNNICVMWSRLGPFRGTTWTPNHFVPVLQQTTHACTPQPTVNGNPVESISLSMKGEPTVVGNPVESINACTPQPTVVGNPVESINPPMNGEPTVVGNPVESINPPMKGEPTVVGNPVESINPHMNGEPTVVGNPVESINPPMKGEPTVVGNPVESINPPMKGEPTVVGNPVESINPHMNGEPTVVGNPVESINQPMNGEPTVVGNPVESINPPMNGEPTVVGNPVESINQPMNGEPTVVGNHVESINPYMKGEPTPKPKIYTSTPRHSVTKGQTINLKDECGQPVRITKVTISLPTRDISMVEDAEKTIAYGRDADQGSNSMGNLHDEPRHCELDHYSNVSDDNIAFSESTPDISKDNSNFQHENSSPENETYHHSESIENDSNGEHDEECNATVNRHTLPVPANTYALPSGRFHSKEDAYKLVMTKPYVHVDVPPGDKDCTKMLHIRHTRHF